MIAIDKEDPMTAELYGIIKGDGVSSCNFTFNNGVTMKLTPTAFVEVDGVLCFKYAENTSVPYRVCAIDSIN